jgi:hypothetical protein
VASKWKNYHIITFPGWSLSKKMIYDSVKGNVLYNIFSKLGCYCAFQVKGMDQSSFVNIFLRHCISEWSETRLCVSALLSDFALTCAMRRGHENKEEIK